MYAAQQGSLEKVRFLLARGADPNAKDSRGGTAVSHARSKRHNAVVDLLERVMADPEVGEICKHT